MRLNRYVALATGLSRRAADAAIAGQRVRVNGRLGQLGEEIRPHDKVTLDGKTLAISESRTTIMLNKPVGYVCSRDGQGSQTIYDLLPPELHNLKPVGRLDKDSSGLLMLTNNGKLAHELTHPSFQKVKIYEVELDKPLSAADKAGMEKGIELEDGLSRLRLQGEGKTWTVTMTEGRNRQIRRSFGALGYKVVKLHRTQFGHFRLNDLVTKRYKKL